VLQQKTQHPVQFELTQPTREALEAWTKLAELKSDCFLFPKSSRSSSTLNLHCRRTIAGLLSSTR